MAEIKTKPTTASVKAFVEGLDDERRRDESRHLIEMMREATGEPPVMWGESIVGFGNVRAVYESGREVDWFLVGFSPRKRALSLYLMPGAGDRFREILGRLGPHKHGAGCLYITRLARVEDDVLRELVAASVQAVRDAWGSSGA